MENQISNTRPTWEEYALMLAHTASHRSEDVHCRVGACALDHNNRVLGVAYNGLCSGKQAPVGFWDDRDARRPYMIHAEVNLLSLFKKGEAKLIATTLSPCTSCAQMICAYDIKKVVYMDDYKRDMQAEKIFNFYGVTLEKISSNRIIRCT